MRIHIPKKILQFSFWFSPLLAGYFYYLGFPDQGRRVFFAGPLVAMLLVFMHSPDLPQKYEYKDFLRWCLFFVSANFFGYSWLSYTMQEFGNYSAITSQILSTCFAAIIFPQFFPYLLLRISQDFFPRIWNKIYPHLHPELMIWPSAMALTLLEILVPQQFPAHLGHAWLALAPRVGLAPYIGASGLSFLSYLLVFSILAHFKTKQPPRFNYAFFTVALAFNLLYPLDKNSNLESPKENLRIKIVQANIGNMLKLQSERGHMHATDAVLSGYEKLSLEAPRADLTIWPETAYPKFIGPHSPLDMALYHPRLSDFLQNLQGELIFGGYLEAPFQDGQNPWVNFEDVYNSVIHIGPDLEILGTYNKQKLIPFGETLPFPSWVNQKLAPYLPAVSFFAKGQSSSLFHLPKNFKATALICYEILFSNLVRNHLNTLEKIPDFIINVTNDSWYGNTSEPYQHKFLAHWRALEIQTPVIRATNTGISSILYPDGSESETLKWDEINSLHVDIPRRQGGITLYQTAGDTAWIFLALIFTFLQILNFRKKNMANQ